MKRHFADAGKIVRFVTFILCQGFCLFSVPRLAIRAGGTELLLAVVSVGLVCVPALLERLLRCRIATPLYVFCLLYAVGALLGHGYDFYYILPWWDQLLHVCGGVVFGVMGLFLGDVLNGGKPVSMALKAVFALCFSMAVAVVWEFFEYAMDVLFAMDMQNDTIVSGIHSYLLGGGMGEFGSIPNVTSVIVNGAALPFEGYLDIGLHDTMTDMLVETLGAAVCTGLCVLDRGRHTMIVLQT